MKVFEIYDPEWDNQIRSKESLLRYLWKKQWALSDEVQAGIQKLHDEITKQGNKNLVKNYPGKLLDDFCYQFQIGDSLRLFHYTNVNEEGLIETHGEQAYRKFIERISRIPKLKQAWDLMVKAKKEYEKAGGFYIAGSVHEAYDPEWDNNPTHSLHFITLLV